MKRTWKLPLETRGLLKSTPAEHGHSIWKNTVWWCCVPSDHSPWQVMARRGSLTVKNMDFISRLNLLSWTFPAFSAPVLSPARLRSPTMVCSWWEHLSEKAWFKQRQSSHSGPGSPTHPQSRGFLLCSSHQAVIDALYQKANILLLHQIPTFVLPADVISTGVMLMPFRIKAIKDVGSRSSPCRHMQTHRRRDTYTYIYTHTKAHTCRAHATIDAGDEARFLFLQMTQLETGLPEQQFPSYDYTGALWVTFQPTEHALLWIMYHFGFLIKTLCFLEENAWLKTKFKHTSIFTFKDHTLSQQRKGLQLLWQCLAFINSLFLHF